MTLLPTGLTTYSTKQVFDLSTAQLSRGPLFDPTEFIWAARNAIQNEHWNGVDTLFRKLPSMFDFETLRRVIFTDCDPNSGYTLLHELASHGAPKALVSAALLMGADPAAGNKAARKNDLAVGNNTAFHLAMENGHLHLAELFLRPDFPVNAVNENGDTAMHLMLLHLRSPGEHRTSKRQTKLATNILQTFLSVGGDLSVRNKNGDDLLAQAVEVRAWEMVERYLQLATALPETTLRTCKLSSAEVRLRALEVIAHSNSPGSVMKQFQRLLNRVESIGLTSEVPSSDKRLTLVRALAPEGKEREGWIKLRSVLEELDIHRDFFGDEFLAQVLNARVPEQSGTLLHLVWDKNRDSSFIGLLLRLGADGEAVADGSYEKGKADRNYRPIHIAAIKGDTLKLRALFEQEIAVDPETMAGSTPLSLYLWHCSDPEPEIISLFTLSGADVTRLHRDGSTFVEHAIGQGHFLAARLLFEYGAEIPDKLLQRRYPIETGGERSFVDVDELLGIITGLIDDGISKTLVLEASKLVRLGGDIFDAYLYLKAAKDSTMLAGERPSVEFAYLVRRGLFKFPAGSFKALVDAVESFMDRNRDEWGWHPNESELFALLNHPSLPKPSPKDLNYLTSALTSITRFMNHDIRVRSDTVHVWRQIGMLTYAFQCWRFDCERIWELSDSGERQLAMPSMFEDFGFERARPTQLDKVFGAQFVLRPGQKELGFLNSGKKGEHNYIELDSQTLIIFRQAYLLVSHPIYGTLIIRNSSPDFGRNTLDHTAYWSDRGVGRGFTVDDLLNLDYGLLDNGFESVLSPRPEQVSIGPERRIYVSGIESMGHLLDQLMAVKVGYGRWKYDTNLDTAWLQDEEQDRYELVGGYRSDGFTTVVRHLKRRFNDFQIDQLMSGNAEKPLPELAFVNPFLPPWSPYQFRLKGGRKMSRLALTSEVIDVLESIAETGTSDPQLEQSTGVREFLQLGLRQQAELVFLNSNRGSIFEGEK